MPRLSFEENEGDKLHPVNAPHTYLILDLGPGNGGLAWQTLTRLPGVTGRVAGLPFLRIEPLAMFTGPVRTTPTALVCGLSIPNCIVFSPTYRPCTVLFRSLFTRGTASH